ncbi:competence protein ComGF [Staphylococcus saccharolyticus]|nr:competence protein ComGF [Staphylococcus saccharolyticus]
MNTKFNYLKIKYAVKILNLKLKHVSLSKLKAFSFIELLFTLSLTILVLMLLPSMICLTSYYLINAKNNDDINFDFFSRDILYDTQKLKYKLQIENSHTIKLSNNNDVIRYVFNRSKIYKNINQKGNITLLNNVVSTQILKTNNKYIKIKIKLVKTNYTQEKILLL